MNFNFKKFNSVNNMKNQIFITVALFIGSFVLLSMNISKTFVQDPWEVPAKYQKMENPHASDADADNVGKMLYSKHCKSCHGTKGKGDGPKAEGLETSCGDFTSSSFKEQTDGSLYYKMIFGRDEMPGFDKKIPNEKDRWLIVNYLRGL